MQLEWVLEASLGSPLRAFLNSRVISFFLPIVSVLPIVVLIFLDISSFHVVPQRTAMNGNETGTVEYSTELAFNSNLPNLIVLNVAFYMHLIRQFDSAHVKCDV